MTMEQLATAALQEDVGSGDVTSLFFVPETEQAKARLFAKEPGVVAGTAAAVEVFRQLDPATRVDVVRADGSAVEKGDTILEVEGSARTLLIGERTALNFLQRLTGVATLTRRYVEAVAGTGARVLDTRKTTPGWRLLEKAAVAAGGGTNHRIGLFDAVMVKDNHLLAEARLEALQHGIDAVKAARPGIKVQLEADTLDQVRDFLGLRGVDALLLDNMPCAALREAVALARASGNSLTLEASGGVTLETIRAIAETGVDFISVGALTHSARALDISMEFTRVTLG